jgi:sugar phosphate isomerase/epimerase
MELGINLGYVSKQRGNPSGRPFKEALQLCRDAGFMQLDYLSPLLGDDWESLAEQRREDIEQAGLLVHQSHCPFFRYQRDGADRFAQIAPRAVRAAAILGAQFLVVHADEYRVSDRYEQSEILNATYEYLAPIVELGKKLGVRIAIENLFEDGYGPQINGRSRYCSTVEELLALLERFNDPAVGCCWDFGHGRCSYGDEQLAALQQVGKHLFCTHVHDNYYGKDLHLPPFLGSIDWEAQLQYLQNSGYTGHFIYELSYGIMPDELLPSYLQFIHQCGRFLLDKAN